MVHDLAELKRGHFFHGPKDTRNAPHWLFKRVLKVQLYSVQGSQTSMVGPQVHGRLMKTKASLRLRALNQHKHIICIIMRSALFLQNTPGHMPCSAPGLPGADWKKLLAGIRRLACRDLVP